MFLGFLDDVFVVSCWFIYLYDDLWVEGWSRFLFFIRDVFVYICGIVGCLVVSGLMVDVWLLFCFGEYFYVGSECVFGLGCFVFYG